MSGERAARVALAAEGNPLIARETARAAAAGLPPEEGLRGSVRASLAGLPGAGRDLVALAAAAGRPLSPGEAGEILGAEPAAHARDVATEAGLLLPQRDGRLAFAHDLVARACESELAPERLGWAHRSLAEALAGRPGGRAAELARHLRLAGRAPRAVPYLAAAAAEARRLGALDEAAGFLAEGIALAPAPGAEAELWLGLADVHAWRGDREGLDAAFGRARALLERAGDPAALAAAWAARGRWLRTSICYPRESLEAYRTALALLERDGIEAPEVEVLARAGSAWAESVAGDPERAEAEIAALAGRPDAADDPVLSAELALDRTMALIRSGRMAEADEQGLRALAVAEEAGRPELGAVALGNIAAAAAARGDFARCLELVERALPDDRISPGLAVHILAARAYALSRLGRHPEAVEAARAQEALAGRVGTPGLEATAAFDLGCVLLAGGEPAAAAERLGAALSAAGAHFSRPLARLLRAQALAALGDPGAAAEELGRFPFEPVGPGDLPETLVGRLPRTQALVEMARGEPERALRHLDEAERVWRRRLASAPEGDVFAAVVADLGRPPVAGLVEPAVELGLTLADRAEALATLGRLDEAQAAAREAAALADETGFEGYRDRLVTDARVL